MKRMSMCAVALAATMAMACGGGQNEERRMTGGDPSQPGVGAEMAATGDQNDNHRQFVQRAAEANLADIELGRMAQERAQNPQVKQFGQMMVEEHTKALENLRQIARRENIQIQEQLNQEHRQVRDRLQSLSGAEFDREFMEVMVNEHEQMQQMLEDRAGDTGRMAGGDRQEGAPVGTAGEAGIERELNQWASKVLPAVEGHLQRAESIREQLGNAAGNTRGGANPTR